MIGDVSIPSLCDVSVPNQTSRTADTEKVYTYLFSVATANRKKVPKRKQKPTAKSKSCLMFVFDYGE